MSSIASQVKKELAAKKAKDPKAYKNAKEVDKTKKPKAKCK